MTRIDDIKNVFLFKELNISGILSKFKIDWKTVHKYVCQQDGNIPTGTKAWGDIPKTWAF